MKLKITVQSVQENFDATFTATLTFDDGAMQVRVNKLALLNEFKPGTVLELSTPESK